MAWTADFISAEIPTAAKLNQMLQDDRNWQGNINAGAFQLTNLGALLLKVQALPASPSEGMVAYDGAAKALKFYDGAAWKASGGGGSPWTGNVDAGGFEIRNVSKIGVGTAAPADPIEVVGLGSAKITTKTTAANAYSVFAMKTDAKEWQFAASGSTGAYPNSFYIYDNTSGRICLRIDSNGNVYLLSLPVSSAGLSSGALWVDTAAGNVVKRVP